MYDYIHSAYVCGCLVPQYFDISLGFPARRSHHPAFHCLQYSKAGEGLVSFLTWVRKDGGKGLIVRTVKWERAWYLFSCEWNQDRKDGRKGLIVCRCRGPRTARRTKIYRETYYTHQASKGQSSYTPSVECVVSQIEYETLPTYFHQFPIGVFQNHTPSIKFSSSILIYLP